mgnify:CR=1 FL=1
MVCKNWDWSVTLIHSVSVHRKRSLRIASEILSTFKRKREEIKIFLSDRFGNEVLYNPGLNSSTYILWIAPGLFLFIALLMFFFRNSCPKVSLVDRRHESDCFLIDLRKGNGICGPWFVNEIHVPSSRREIYQNWTDFWYGAHQVIL